MRALAPRDRFHLATSALYLALGATIAVRSVLAGVWPGALFGAAMLALGLYRGYYFYRAFREFRR